MASRKMMLRTMVCALALGVAACSGSDIASPGATNSGGGGTGGGGTGGGGTGGGGTGGGTVIIGGVGAGNTTFQGGGFFATCPVGTTQEAALVNNFTVCALPSNISSNLTLPRVNNVLYKISGRTDVGTDVGTSGTGGTSVTLTIDPGVVLFGANGLDYLVVNRGSRLVADGTQAAPIVFTSRNDVTNTGNRATARGEWGGIVLLGRAPINECRTPGATGGNADCDNEIEGVSGAAALYGGNVAADNSGVLRYVQVRHSGFELSPGRELNGISFGGVGSGTVVERVQVHNSSDDGVEFFGGTVSAKYLLLTGNDDDSIDWDMGWNGSLQFVVAVQGASSGDKIIEADNYGGTITTLTADLVNKAPRSNPTLANFTFVGTNPNSGASAGVGGVHLREGTSGLLVNGVVTGSLTCLDIDNQNIATATPSFRSVLLGCGTAFNTDSDNEGAIFVAGTDNNVIAPSSLTGVLPGPTELGMTASATPAGLTAANYVGAFSATETAGANWTTGWAKTNSIFTPPAACPAGTTEDGTIAGLRRCVLPSAITGNLTLTNGNIYQINGRTDVGTDVVTGGTAATLTVEAGVTVFGRNGLDYLVVNRGSKLFANGTAAQPVVFTSFNDVTTPSRSETTAQGEWGGLVLLGRAPINECRTPGAVGGAADCDNEIEGVSGTAALYGGNLPDDSSGRLSYVQVRYPGFELSPGRELNGISFGGVGRGTEVNHVQVHQSSDDGVEFFGGTVNAKYLILTGNDDDSIDWDMGFSGNLQFVVVQQRASGGDKIIEADNYGGTITTLTGALVNKDPRSNPTLANFTFIGSNPNSGASAGVGGVHLREGTAGTLVNGIITGSVACLDIDNQSISTALPTFGSVLMGCGTAYNTDSDNEATTFEGGSNNVPNAALTLSGFVNGTFENGATAQPTPSGSFFTAAPYVGAVRNSSDNWWTGWTCGLPGGTSC